MQFIVLTRSEGSITLSLAETHTISFRQQMAHPNKISEYHSPAVRFSNPALCQTKPKIFLHKFQPCLCVVRVCSVFK